MTRRVRELLFLVLAGSAVTVAYATAYVAQSKVLDPGSLVWGGAFLVLLLSAHLAVRRMLPQADPYLLPAVGLLAGLGVTMINRLRPDLSHKQAGWIVIGLAAMVVLVWKLPDHRVLERYKYVIGAVAVLLLVITISPLGSNINGAHLWVVLGPVSIQPGEFAKVLMVVFLAAYLRENRELLGMGFNPKHLGPLVLFWGASLGLLVLMNDFGTSLLFYGTFLLMVYVATARAWYLAVGVSAFAAGSIAVYRVAAHVHERFQIWLDPWKDPQGTGYQLLHGLYAMADGRLFGRGLGQAFLVVKPGQTLIPAAQTDFIFAAIADELGFVGAVALLLVYVVVAWRGFTIAARASDGFSKLLAFGLATAFTLQSIIIVGGVVRLLPLTGQTLPFVSYGGSSVLANFLLVGLLMIVSHHANTEADARVAAATSLAPEAVASGRARRRAVSRGGVR